MPVLWPSENCGCTAYEPTGSSARISTARLPTCSTSWPGPWPRTSADGEKTRRYSYGSRKLRLSENTISSTRDFDHDVIGLRAGIVLEARQPLQTRRTGGQHLDGFSVDFLHALLQAFFLAESNLGGNVRPRHRQGARLAAAAFRQLHLIVHQGVHHGERLRSLDRRVARVMVQVA